MSNVDIRANRWLGALGLLYTAASVLHFIHNAEFVSEYPNLPASLTRFGVYLALAGVVAVGIAGVTIYRLGWQRLGLLIIGAYAALGFDGLLHYTLAPFSAHSTAMNFTIWFEFATAAGLFFVVAAMAAKRLRAT